MKILMVTGLDIAERDSLTDIAVKRCRLEINYIKFSDLLSEKNFRNLKNTEDLNKLKTLLKKQMETTLTKYLKENKHIVVNGYFTIKTPYGIFPLLSESFFHIFKPNGIIILETDPENELIDQSTKKQIKEHQDINRDQAELFSTYVGCPFKIIKIDKNNIRETLNKIIETFRMILR